MTFPQKFHSVLFDLDGTLVDTAPDLTIALNKVLADMDRPSFPVSSVRNMVGRGARNLIIHALEQSGGLLDDEEIDRMHKEYLDHYAGAIADESAPFDGCENMLQTLKSRGVQLGISTNKPQALAESLINELGMAHYFTAIRGWDGVSSPKPDKAHLVETLGAMGTNTDGALMVGDSRTDQKAAHSAGMPVALVTYGYTQEPIRDVPGDIFLERLGDVVDLFPSDES